MRPYHKKLLTSLNNASAYILRAVTFDGTNDYLTRGADLTGNADGQQGTVSFWAKFDAAADNNTVNIIGTDGARFRLLKQDNSVSIPNTIRLLAGSSAAPSDAIDLRSNDDAGLSSAGWVHVLLSWDLSGTPTGAIYVNDVLQTENTQSTLSKTIDYTRVDHSIGADPAGTLKYNGDIGQIYVNFSEYVDLSIEANRRKFISAAGKPVDLGSDGSLPTGTAPILFLDLAAGAAVSTFATNKGAGGGMTTTGALTEAASSPSD